jgi:glycosyltransferase involved in cell wall biosynthesis
VHVVVPGDIDDPTRPSGGNTYDQHLCCELGRLGWSVNENRVAGCWPRPDAASFAALAGVVQRIPDDAVVLLDGLVASTAPEILVPQASRLRILVLVHMPLGHRPADEGAQERERRVLASAASVLTTSAWTRRRLMELYSLPAHLVRVAEPGVDAADLSAGTAAGGALLCVGPVTFEKGHDVLLEALDSLRHLSWECVCVGSLDRDRAFAERLRHDALDGRVSFPGPRTGAELARDYATADLLVLPSRAETYGMVVTEALARGLPVIASDVGGVSGALGWGADGNRPGLLVAPGDSGALGAALRAWLGDAELRGRLRRAARVRRESLRGWSTTASDVAAALSEAAR